MSWYDMSDDCHEHCLYSKHCRKVKTDGNPNRCDEFNYWDHLHDDNYDDYREDEYFTALYEEEGDDE